MEETTKELQVLTAEQANNAVMPGFSSHANWELAQRIGKAFAASSLVPAAFKDNLPNCIIALEMANRMGASPLLVMQNLYVVHGTPGWSSKFLIASFNQCGRFSALRYEWNADRTECRAWAIEKATGERIEGPMVSMEIAKKEGWSTKNGSKWQTMPELMLMYRAAAFLIRTYAPEISMGLQTAEEVEDVAQQQPVGTMTIRLSPKQMQQAQKEVEQGKTTPAEILEKNPALPEDQKLLIASWEANTEAE